MIDTTIQYLIKAAHSNADTHGFWDEIKELEKLKDSLSETVYEYLKNAIIGNLLMLIAGELGEAQEGLRHNDIANFKEELADVIIRTFDLAGGLGIDLQSEILKKMKKNESRLYKHGKLF